MMDKQAIEQELILRALAKKDLYTFVKLKWARYNLALSYGKTEIIARCFIAWALGLDRSRKFFYKQSARYCVLDCFCGIWSEEDTINHILQAKQQYPQAKTYIESEAGGLVLHRLLMVELVKFNQQAKEHNKPLLNDYVYCYTPSRKVSKVEKIKAMRPYYNTGFLVFSHACQNQEQLKKELFSFNPDRPYKQDDCIDALASCLNHSEVKAPFAPKQEITQGRNPFKPRPTWRV